MGLDLNRRTHRDQEKLHRALGKENELEAQVGRKDYPYPALSVIGANASEVARSSSTLWSLISM